ncbi:long-chain acyl-CoA synthetase [Microbacterium hydrothermale]|uniref:AMP-dependent synthetase/ligase n=1 Tax=Microbacterium hydrothermale TaxID=857427 RepID=UPI0022271C08|nr:AMP-dependent synthetase/ligase [Microbacterium hydrothermale]MCW2165852.1 long-chain acyl-CoA synthetase [Microbacterium hydrothermale]
MRESHTPALASLDAYANVTDLLVRRAAEAPDHVAFEVPPSGSAGSNAWTPVTTAAFLAEVRALAKSLVAVGLAPGDAVAIMAPTRYEWAVADLATWFAGGVVVPVYESSSASQVEAIVADARIRVGIGGADAHVALLTDALASADDTVGVWSMDDLATLADRGAAVSDEELEHRRTRAGHDDPATIVYTSGTTGEPKGAVLTHANFLGQVLNIAAAYREVVHPAGNTIIFLPLAHVLARGLQLICIASGMRIAHLADPAAVVPTLATLRPTFLVVVPRVLQKIQAAAGDKAAAKGLSGVWGRARSTAIAAGRLAELQDAGTPRRAPLGHRVRHAVFDALFYRRLRAVMGGRVDYMLSGGATLDGELSLFFRGLGVPVIEGYGLTETTAPLTGNLPGRIASGTVGLPLPGSTVRISDEGEVLARGVGVFAGYRDPKHDGEAFVDGFFRTGDLGRLDDAGRLVLEGRLKDVIVTSNGKTVVPVRWESAVEADPLVQHAVVVGEGKPYLSALLILDAEQAAAWAASAGLPFDARTPNGLRAVDEPRLHAHLQRAVDAANALVARSEQVRRFELVVADLGDRELVTPTLKIKRRVVVDRAADTIESLYRGAPS